MGGQFRGGLVSLEAMGGVLGLCANSALTFLGFTRLHSASLVYLRLSPGRERVCARALRFCRLQGPFSSWFGFLLPSRQSCIRVVALPIVSARRPQTVGILGLLLSSGAG